MENKIFRKTISVDRVFCGSDPKIGLHFYFSFKPFMNSSDTQRERERKKKETSSLHTDPPDPPTSIQAPARLHHKPTHRSTHLVHQRDRATNHPSINPPRPSARSRHKPTNRSTHPMGDPLLDRPTSSTSESHPRTDLSLSLSHDTSLVILIFFSYVAYIFWFSVIIFVWILRKCEKHDKNWFSRAFSATQPNTRKYFPKHFLKYNQTLKNIFLSWKYFTLEIFYIQKIFYAQRSHS